LPPSPSADIFVCEISPRGHGVEQGARVVPRADHAHHPRGTCRPAPAMRNAFFPRRDSIRLGPCFIYRKFRLQRASGVWKLYQNRQTRDSERERSRSQHRRRRGVDRPPSEAGHEKSSRRGAAIKHSNLQPFNGTQWHFFSAFLIELFLKSKRCIKEPLARARTLSFTRAQADNG
jgi:hypothetical protein